MPSLLPTLVALAALAPSVLADTGTYNYTSLLPLLLEEPRADLLSLRRCFSVLGYTPSIPLALVATIAFVALTLVILYRWWQYRWNLAWVLIGSQFFYAVGCAMRVSIHSHPYSMMNYIISNMFMLLPPCFFLGFDYLVFGRLARSSGAGHYLFLNENKISKIFLTSDIVTFMLQCGGGGMSAVSSMRKIGTALTLVGIIAQFVSFLGFTCLVAHWGFVVRKYEPRMWFDNTGKWKSLCFAVLYTCVGFIIRSVFRSIELAQGYHGSLSLNEAFLYGLDTLPLFLALLVFIPIFPGRFFGPKAPSSVQFSTVNSQEYPLKP